MTRSDAFRPDFYDSQNTLAFEKANVLYNLAARIVNGCISRLGDADPKSGFKPHCIGATIFDWISSNFSNAPLFDIAADCSKFLSTLCLLQAQELAFFSSVEEEKGLKVLARLSLGIVNLLGSLKDQLPQPRDHDMSWMLQAINAKMSLHNVLHCLIMAEYWDTQQLIDISHNLFTAAAEHLLAADIRDKTPLQEYLKISTIRAEREREQTILQNSKASESAAKVEPFFLATLLDFGEVVAPYAASYQSLFTGIYPVAVIEQQSVFESKAMGIVKGIEKVVRETDSLYHMTALRKNITVQEVLLELRDGYANMQVGELKRTMTSVDQSMERLRSEAESLRLRYSHLKGPGGRDGLAFVERAEKELKALDGAKLKLILNDSAFLQMLTPIVQEGFASFIQELQAKIAAYSQLNAQRQEKLERLKEKVRSH